jgi:hypothetical protein
MGFDMKWRTPPPELVHALDFANAQIDAVREQRDNAAPGSPEFALSVDLIRSLLVQKTQNDSSQFHLNPWSMKWLVAFLLETDMGYASRPLSGTPVPSTYGIDAADRNAFNDWLWGDLVLDAEFLPAKFVACRDAIETFLASSETPDEGIALHKLATTNGWIVTPAECLSALERYDNWLLETGRPEDFAPWYIEDDGSKQIVEWWDDFIEYLIESAQHGGFVVN